MAKQKSKAELLKDIQIERRGLEKTLARLPAQTMMQPGIVGDWSVKDVLMHLVEWERLFLAWYRCGKASSSPEVPPVGMGRHAIDQLNEQFYEKNKDRDLAGVLQEFNDSYRVVWHTLQEISEEELFAPAHYSWTGKYLLADYVAGNTCNHYRWAKMQIRKGLSSPSALESS